MELRKCNFHDYGNYYDASDDADNSFPEYRRFENSYVCYGWGKYCKYYLIDGKEKLLDNEVITRIYKLHDDLTLNVYLQDAYYNNIEEVFENFEKLLK